MYQQNKQQMKNFIIVDRSQKNKNHFISNGFGIGQSFIIQISPNAKDAKRFNSKDDAQKFIDKCINHKDDFIII